jgi:hypothetical protein
MSVPTPQDAQLVVQLAQLAAVQGLDKVVAWLFAHKMPTEPAAFGERYPAGSKGHRHATAVLNYVETMGLSGSMSCSTRTCSSTGCR